MRKQKYFKQAAAIGTAVVLACGMTGCGSTSNDKEDTKEESSTDSEEKLVETMNSVTGMSSNEEGSNDKEETVYVIADNTGKPTDIIVSEWLKNLSGEDTIEDQTNLTDIKNVKGNEKFSSSGNKIVWESNGSDIYYQGKSNEDLPVSVKVTYYLDGKQISPENLLGKSGEVKIRYDYANESTSTASVNGKSEEIFTPFVMATGMMLPTTTFKNVRVSNGEVISEGNNLVVVGMAMPGLKDNLALDEMDNLDMDIEIPDYFEVTADVQDFNIGMSVTFCSNTLVDMNKILADIDTDNLNSDIDDLTDGANQLVDGTGKLSDGTNTLKDGTGKLSDGTNTLANGTSDLSAGVNSLSDGVLTYTDGVASVKDGASQLADGTDALDDGANTLVDGLASAKSGADQIKSGLEGAKSGSTQIKDGAASAKDGAATLAQKLGDAKDGSTQIKDGLSALNNSAPALISGIEAAQNGLNVMIQAYEGDAGLVAGAKAVSEGLSQLNEQVKGLSLPDVSGQSSTLTDDQKVLVEQSINAYLSSEEGQAVLNQSTASFINNVEGLLAQNGVSLDAQTKGTLEAVITGVFKQAFTNIYISAYESGMEKGMSQVLAEVSSQMETYAPMISQLQGAVTQLADGSAKVSAGVESMYGGTSQLADGMDQMYTKASALPNGVNQLYEGSSSLENGLGQLQDGAEKLHGGADQLYTGTSTLDSGLSQLYEGSKSLNDGIGQLYSGAGSLKAGTSKLRSGSHTLVEGVVTLDSASSRILNGFVDLKAGVKKLDSGAKELNDGAKQLDDGAKDLQSGVLELKDGMVKLNDEGISKINSLVKEDVNGIIDRLDAVSSANDDYTLYGGIADGKSGSEKFIIKIDGIEEK